MVRFPFSKRETPTGEGESRLSNFDKASLARASGDNSNRGRFVGGSFVFESKSVAFVPLTRA